MATAAEEKLQTALKEAVDLRAQVKERFKAFQDSVHPRKVSIKDLKNPAKFANNKEAEAAATLYRRLNDSTNEIKALNRGLGGLVSTDPEFYADKGLLDEILNVEPGRNDKLKSVLEAWDSKISYYGKTIKGKVGHHPTALSTLREALLGKDLNYRQAFKKMALEQGYEIGEEFIRYIDPAAHKSFGAKVQGLFKEKGIKLEGNEALFKELQDRMAHAWWAGSTGGTSVHPGATASSDVAKGLQLAEPNLLIDKTGTASGDTVEKILNRWSKKDFGGDSQKAIIDLTNTLKRTPVPKVEGIWKHGAEVTKSLGPLTKPQTGLITDSRVESLFPSNMKIQGDGTAALTQQTNFFEGAVDNIASSADNLLAQTTGLVNHLKMQGIKTAIQSPEQLASQLSTKYGTAGAMSMLLDPKFRQAMNEGRFTDAATRLVIEEAIGDAAFKGLKAGYHNIPGVKPLVKNVVSKVAPIAKTIAGAGATAKTLVGTGGLALLDMAFPQAAGVTDARERELINMSLQLMQSAKKSQDTEARWNNPDRALENVKKQIEKEHGKGAIYKPNSNKTPKKPNKPKKPKKLTKAEQEQMNIDAQYGGPGRPWGLGT